MSGWKFNAVSVTFWHDRKVRRWSPDARMLALYLLTCSASTGPGFYVLTPGTALDELHWERDRFDDAMRELRETDFADFDDEAYIVLVVKALKHRPPLHGAKTIKGALNAIETAQGSPRLFGRFLEAADRYEPEFAAAIRERYTLPDGPYSPAP